MKVLAISASPRKCGNAEVLCDEFLKGAAESGHDVQKIRLAEKKIAPCLACYACAGSHVCVRRDDMAEVLEALKAADVIVLASPVYFYSICAQMKTMIDHPFCTHEGSGLANTVRDVQRAAKGAKVGKGLAIHGGSVDGARAALEKWVQEGE